MTDNNLKIALQNIYDSESAQYISGADAEFSPKFERGMERMLKGGKRSKGVRFSKKLYVVMVAAAAVASLGIGATAGANMARGFATKEGYSKVFNRPTLTFSAANAQSCPEVIERFYSVGALSGDEDYRYGAYLNDKKTEFHGIYAKDNTVDLASAVKGDDEIVLWQWTKAEFSETFEVPAFVEISETTVNGCPAYLIVKERYYGTDVQIVWDNGDYIMLLRCASPVGEAMRLAESVAEDENALVKEG